jgi:hypothetical protein
MDNFSSGLAGLGKFKAVSGFIFMTIIFIILLTIGILIIINNTKYKKTSATILESSCRNVTNQYNCDISLNYMIDTNQYNNYISFSNLSNILEKNQTIDIEYRNDNPLTIRQPNKTLSWIGWILIGIGIIFLLIGIFSTIAVFKYKSYAVFTGAQALIPRTRPLINIRVRG